MKRHIIEGYIEKFLKISINYRNFTWLKDKKILMYRYKTIMEYDTQRMHITYH